LFGLFVLVLMGSVFGVGISPGKIVVYYEPGGVEQVDFYVANFGNEPIRAKVYFKGEFNNSIDFEPQVVDLDPLEREYFSFNFSMPYGVDEPGDHVTMLVAEEMPYRSIKEGTFIGALAAVNIPVILRVPKNGPYLTAKLYATSTSVGQPVEFRYRLDNLGNVALDNLNISIDIIDPNGTKIWEINYEDSLGLNEIKEDRRYWDSSGSPAGSYVAILRIKYNGKTFETNTSFMLGDMFIDILNIQDEIFSETINEFNVKLKSGWNEEIKDVFIKLSIDVGEEELIFKSENFDIGAWKEKNVKMYVDARTILKGDYSANLMVSYNGLSNSKDFVIHVIKKENDYLPLILISGASIIFILILIYLIKVKVKMARSAKKS